MKVLVDKRSTEQRRADAVRALHDCKKAGEAVPHFLEALEVSTPAVNLRPSGDRVGVRWRPRGAQDVRGRDDRGVRANRDHEGDGEDGLQVLQGEAGQPLGALGSVALDAIVELAGHLTAPRGERRSTRSTGSATRSGGGGEALVPAGHAWVGAPGQGERRDAAFATRSWGALAAPLVPALVAAAR
ncbi:MAG: hypothetical protein R3A52_27900 [Polyangiales bacterium]